MAQLVLIRGLPGSGKSTIARGMVGFEHIEADMYFERDDGYHFDADQLDQAHHYCLRRTQTALKDGKNVVVANTFSLIREMAPYFQLGFPVRIIEANGKFPSIHAVSEDVIKAMAARWEALPTEYRSGAINE